MKLNWLLKLDPATLRLLIDCGDHWDIRIALDGLPPNEAEIMHWFHSAGKAISLKESRDFYDSKLRFTKQEIQRARLNLKRMHFSLNKALHSPAIDSLQMGNRW